MNSESWKFILEFIVAVADLIKVAIEQPDPAMLKKVTDVLPANSGLKSRAALIVAEAQARKDLADA